MIMAPIDLLGAMIAEEKEKHMTTLSGTLSNALTGLNASSRQAAVIADNVANALTEGYGRRELNLTPRIIGSEGQGVQVVGVSRVSDPQTTGARRLAEAASAQDNTIADARARLADAVGEPGDPNALSSLADAFDTALTATADTPESTTLLSRTVQSAGDYARKFNEIGAEIRAVRTNADAAIARQITEINTTLKDVEQLNLEIQINTLGGNDVAALQDQRQRLIDQISGAIPLKVLSRDNNQVALIAKNGGQLLDGRAFELEFSASPVVTQDQTIGNGALSGIVLNGFDIPIGTGDGRGLYDGGSLSANFELRDQIAPELSVQLDALARDLVDRVQGLPEDPTLAPTDPGLFTDLGADFDPLNEEGLAERLTLNPLVDPQVGGDVTRLRDGLNATALGDLADPTVLRGLQDALFNPVAAAAGSGFFGQRSSAGFAAEFSSGIFSASVDADGRAAIQAGRFDTLADAETNLVGVDTDQQLARLLVVEQAFAANARVIQVVDELLEELTRL